MTRERGRERKRGKEIEGESKLKSLRKFGRYHTARHAARGDQDVCSGGVFIRNACKETKREARCW